MAASPQDKHDTAPQAQHKPGDGKTGEEDTTTFAEVEKHARVTKHLREDAMEEPGNADER